MFQKEKPFKSLFEYYRFTENDEKEYPVISKILRFLTPERINKEIKTIQKVKLPIDLRKWIEEYEKIGERDRFIWKWLYKINKIWVHPSIQPKYSLSLAKIKTLYNMFIVLIDDVAEDKNKERLLNKLLLISSTQNKIKQLQDYELILEEKKYLQFTIKVWKTIIKTIKIYPHYNEFRDLFFYDTDQFLNAVKYTNNILKHPYFINSTEYWLYIPHSMQIMIDFDLDAMCSSKNILKNIKNDIGTIRPIILCLQKMGRIGNWITTWEREVKNNDLTSIVVPYAIENQILEYKDIQSTDKNKIIKKIKSSFIEKRILKEWEEYYKKLIDLSGGNKVISTEKISQKARYLILMHLISRKLK